MEFIMSRKVVNPGTVHLVLPEREAAARACRKLLAVPGSPERVADMIHKLSGIMFKDEERKFIRYEWILLIMEKIFENEPFSDDLDAILDDKLGDDAKKDKPINPYRPEGYSVKEDDFSDFHIPDFEDLFDKSEGQFANEEEYLEVLKDVCADFLTSVQLLLDVNFSKKEGNDIIVSLDGTDVSFTKFMDEFSNGDLLERFSIDQLLGMLIALPPGVLEKISKRLDEFFFQGVMKRKFYNLSLKRYLGRITYYKKNESDNPYFKDKVTDYQTIANSVSKKISKNETNTSILLDFKDAISTYIESKEAGQDNQSAKNSALSKLGSEFEVKVEEKRMDASSEKAPASTTAVHASSDDAQNDANQSKDQSKDKSKPEPKVHAPEIDD